MMADVKEGPTLERDFSKVILTLDNVLIPVDKLSPTPSLQDGLDLETETDLRILGCELIQTAGILLKLPQVAMATGQVVYQRFYYSKSFVKHNMEVLAMACVNLASKIEEAPRRIRDVINVFHHVKQVRNGKTIQPLILDQHYINLKNQVIKAERRILKELGFCVHVQHPHKSIVMFLQVLECEKNRRLVQTACEIVCGLTAGDVFGILGKQTIEELLSKHISFPGVNVILSRQLAGPVCNGNNLHKNYMNDSFRTDVFVQFQPETIGCACIYLAARQLQIPLPNSPPWYSLFNVEEEEVQEICMSILKLYARSKPNYDELEKIVNEAKKIQIEAKLKAKGLSSEQGTPNSNSRPCTPKNVSPNPASMGSMKKNRSEVDLHENNTPVEKNHSKKRSHSPDRHGGSSKSLSSRSQSSRSRSPSLSPHSKSRKYRSSPKKQKKDRYSPDRYREKHHSHKHDKRRKRSFSRSRSRSLSPSPEHRHGHKKYYKDKVRYRSPEPHRRSHKHRNGHNSPIRDKYSKYYHR